jgi:signal transduction histidine kinase
MGLRRGEVLGAVVVAAVQVAGTAGAAHSQAATGRPYEPLAWGLLVLSAAGLLLRRRSAVAALVATAVPVWVYLALGYPRGPVYLAVIGALIGALVRGQRVAAWVALAVGYPMFVWVAPLVAGQPPPQPATAVGTAAWLVACAAVVELVKSRRERAVEFRRTRAEESRRRAGEQRMAIARELHDVLAHHISLISVQAGVALHLMDEQPEQARTALTAIRQASRESLGELRSVLELLRHGADGPDGPDGADGAPRAPAPGLEALDALVERTSAAGLPVTVEVTGAARPLPAAVGLAAYRIVQEALTNVTRHAGRPVTATVRLDYAPDQLTVEVTDDGPGAEDISGTGSGLLGMAERAAALGGRLDAGPRPGGGFQVVARLPVRERVPA